MQFRRKTTKLLDDFFAMVDNEVWSQNLTAQQRFGHDTVNYFYLPNPRGWHIHVMTPELHKHLTDELYVENVHVHVRQTGEGGERA